MAYTDIGETAGVVYDVNEPQRLSDISNQFMELAEKADRTDTKNKDIIRYSIIGVSAILILVLLKFAVRKK